MVAGDAALLDESGILFRFNDESVELTGLRTTEPGRQLMDVVIVELLHNVQDLDQGEGSKHSLKVESELVRNWAELEECQEYLIEDKGFD